MKYTKLLKILKDTLSYKREGLIILYEHITLKWSSKN